MPVLRLFIRVVTINQQFGKSDDSIQRRTYLMTHISQKCRFQPIGKFSLVLHFLQLLSHSFPLRIVESNAGIANDVSLLITFGRETGNNKCLPILIPFGTGAILKRELLILPNRHADHIFTNTFRILRMSSIQIILGHNCFFGIEIVYRIIERPVLAGLHIVIPIRHTDGLERQFHFVIPFLKLLIQLMKLRNILSKSGKADDFSGLSKFKRNSRNIAVLPCIIILGLNAAGKIDVHILPQQHRLQGIIGQRSVFRMNHIQVLLQRYQLVRSIIINRVVVRFEFLHLHIEIPVNYIIDFHGQFTFSQKILRFFRHSYLFGYIQLGSNDLQFTQMFG